MPDAYYFAYGTLLGVDEMRKYCPSADRMGVAFYAGHWLEFWAYETGTAGVGCHLVDAPGKSAYGVVYRVPQEELASHR